MQFHMGLLRNTWNSTHSQYPTWIHTEFRGLMLKIPCVSSQGIQKILELFRFPHISTVFDVDFHVDFKWKKIPDVEEYQRDHSLNILLDYQSNESEYNHLIFANSVHQMPLKV